MLLKNGFICDFSHNQKADLRIEGGQIVEIDAQISAKIQEEVIDCAEKIIIPALIDLNVYPKTKTLSQKTLTSLSKKAIKGGVATMLVLPDTFPACENEAIIELIKSIQSTIEVNIIPSIKPINAEEKLNNISILHSQGGRAIYIDSSIDGNNLLRITQYAHMLEIPIICFAQDSQIANGVVNEGELASKLGLPSISPLSQTKEIAKISEVARYTNTQFLFSTLTEPEGLEIVDYFRNNKNANINVQTSIHHLILDESAIQRYNTRAKLNPPLKDDDSKQKLLEALKNNKIDMLTSLQCADFNSKKDQVFELASFGIDAISYYFPLAYTYLIKTGVLDMSSFVKMSSKNQSDFLGLNKGEISLGKDADLAIIDLHGHTQITDSFSPYYNQTLSSKIDSVIIGGKIYE
ncbi:amidohydrolase family protein [Helicobacter cappadocius]|uniref:Amidohydrolase family protein n=1 Tax=Helicobacter cappadocius TaxID=3063998 RepID=A0AA90PJ14_9HELI|nr:MULTISPECIES: amidohydrolase family protein [unclassified Helicobacter]MDO7253238.1 amidohydrolase family protein [Helicobacter sp. faydin-H75]MDP2539162.1 amidohydrolase family protein [Helicobacter sp. faydin-H76]